jgi:drug/metabolite transporter (DMT)-like permease
VHRQRARRRRARFSKYSDRAAFLKPRTLSIITWTALAVGALGLAPLAKKMALDSGASTWPVAFMTAAVSAVLVLAWLAVKGRFAALGAMSNRQRLAVLTVGALGSGLVPLLGIYAMTVTTASNRALFQSAYPAATAVAARLLLGERFRPLTYGLIVLVCVGLAMVNLEANGNLRLGWPFWMLLGTLPLIGLSDVIAKRSLDDQPPEIVAVGRALGGSLILAVCLPWYTAALAESLSVSWTWMIAAGTCMAVFAVALYKVFDLTEAAIAASLVAMSPLLTLLLEALFLDVSLGPVQGLGFALVLAAVVALARRA